MVDSCIIKIASGATAMNGLPKSISLIILAMISITSLTTPVSTAIQYAQKWNSDICVKSYSEGALLINDYNSAERLAEYTSVEARSSGTGCASNGPAGITAELSANVSGRLHSVSESIDAIPDNKGRHAVLSRNIQDVAGIFTVDRFIQLWSNSTVGSVSIDWLPCE